jgi:hypothetical protein
MRYAPSRRLERLAERLIPPASAEHALGDLAESSQSDAEYLRNLTSILPRVVWSQIRRRATLGGIVFNIFLTTIVLGPALGFPKAPFFSEPWAVLRCIVPIAVWVVGVTLAMAYGPRHRSGGWSWPIFIGSVAAAILAAALAGLPPARVAAAFAVLVGVVVVLDMPWVRRPATRVLSIESLPDHARLFQRTIWWRNMRESVASVFVLSWSVRSFWSTDGLVERSGFLFITAGALFVLVFLNFRARSRAVPRDTDARTLLGFHRREVARQRDILLAVPYWYLLPFAPGMILLMFANPHNQPLALMFVFAAFCVLVFYGVWRVNVRGVRKLDDTLRQIDTLEPQQ